jgi:AcrR family transcriptional regulator
MNKLPTTTSSRNPATHEAIINAAAEILREKGYAGLTIEGIAKRSGAGKPTIYRWWPNKIAILIELFDRETSRLLQISDIGSTRDEVTEWFTILWEDWQATVSGETYRSILAEVQSDPKALEFFNKSYIPHRRDILMDILKRSQSRGELPGRDLSVIVDYCCGFNWYYLLTHTVPTSKTIKEVVDTIAQSPTLSA